MGDRKSTMDSFEPQKDLKTTREWAADSGLKFNLPRCFLNILLPLTQFAYTLHKNPLSIVSYDFKSYTKCDKNTFRTNPVLVTLKLIFSQSGGRTFHLIFNSFIRHHLEYGNIVSLSSL